MLDEASSDVGSLDQMDGDVFAGARSPKVTRSFILIAFAGNGSTETEARRVGSQEEATGSSLVMPVHLLIACLFFFDQGTRNAGTRQMTRAVLAFHPSRVAAKYPSCLAGGRPRTYRQFNIASGAGVPISILAVSWRTRKLGTMRWPKLAN